MTELRSFQLDFREVFPPFVRQPQEDLGESLFFNDTRTIAIIGVGKRREILVVTAAGDGEDGEPVNFDPNNSPSGRFFKTTSFPVYRDSFKVFRGFNGQDPIETSKYLLDEQAGLFVLYTPLQRGERLIIEYISQADINTPRIFTEEQTDRLYSIYGSPSQENTLSAAAEIAFANGAPRVIAVQGDHTGEDPSWFQAYDALERTQVYMIVPIQNGFYAQTAVAGMDHVQRMSSTPSRKERVLLIGEKPEDDPDDLNGLPRSAVEDFVGEERVIFVGADFPRTVIAGETTDAVGGYLAAAVAGRWASYEYIPTTLYTKNVNRILLDWPTRDLYTEPQLRAIANDGVTLLVRREGTSIVNRFVTTIGSGNPVEEEPSIWRIRDYVAINVRELLENRFVGNVITEEVVDDIASVTVNFLKSLIEQNIITGYANTTAVVDPVEPRQVNVSFDIEPVFPLNDIVTRITVVSTL